MLTDQDRYDAENGFASHDRLRALRHALLEDAADARAMSKTAGLDERFAASLRGKAKAYQHAAGMVGRVIRGEGIRPPVWSVAHELARAFRDRQAARRAA